MLLGPPAGRLGRLWRSDKVACRPTTPPENAIGSAIAPRIRGRHDGKLSRPRPCAPRHPQGSKPRRRGGARVGFHPTGADLGRGGGASERRGDLERGILGPKRGCCAQPPPPPRRRPPNRP